MAETSTAVSFQQVSRHFGEVRAVDAVSFDIADGEFFSMLGPSGSGKTTCLRLIAGFERPTRGHILIHGRPMDSVPPYERDVNTVFQDYALFPHMTVGDNIAYGLMIRKVPKPERRKRVEAMLELVALSSTSRAYCCSTSPWGRSTSSCASRCRSSSRPCSAASASPSSTSRTTRAKRCR
jgi:putative spermidine/putrescine transport system ATP-binding protein